MKGLILMLMLTKSNGEPFTLGEWYSEFKQYISENNKVCPRIEAFYMYGFGKPNLDITQELPVYLTDRKIMNYDYDFLTDDMDDCFLITLMYE